MPCCPALQHASCTPVHHHTVQEIHLKETASGKNKICHGIKNKEMIIIKKIQIKSMEGHIREDGWGDRTRTAKQRTLWRSLTKGYIMEL